MGARGNITDAHITCGLLWEFSCSLQARNGILGKYLLVTLIPCFLSEILKRISILSSGDVCEINTLKTQNLHLILGLSNISLSKQ